MRNIVGIIGLVGLLAVPAAAAQGAGRYKVIVNASNAVSALSTNELSKIFMRHATVWQNGQPVLPVDLTDASAVRQAFTRDILNKDSVALDHYWQQQIFAGRAVPPPSKTTEDEIIEFVRRYPGAIGYVSAATAIGPEMRVVAIVR